MTRVYGERTMKLCKFLITKFFQHLFSAEVNVPAMNVITKVKRRVTDYINESLMAPYT